MAKVRALQAQAKAIDEKTASENDAMKSHDMNVKNYWKIKENLFDKLSSLLERPLWQKTWILFILLLQCFYTDRYCFIFTERDDPKLSSQDGTVPKLGDKAAELVAEAQQGGPILAKAVEAALEPLFLRQVRETSSLKDRNLFEKRKDMENMKNLRIYSIWYRLLKKWSLNELK